MDFVDCLRAFVATAQTGSFSQAAKRLGMSNRLASKYVAGLEERLGVRLLQRTTRRISASPEGEELLRRAPALLDDVDHMLAMVTENARGLSGTLRVSAPVTFGQTHLLEVLRSFATDNPDIVIDLQLDDAYVDLAARGLDVAFRVGEPTQRSLVARKIGSIHSIMLASEDYAVRKGLPTRPEDLMRHDCIVDTNRRHSTHWLLECAGLTQEYGVHVRFMVNSAQVALDMAREGFGIAFCPQFAIRGDFEAQGLVRVLPDYASPASPVSVVWLEGRVMPRKVRSLIDHFVANAGWTL